jgi:hypothetical protein
MSISFIEFDNMVLIIFFSLLSKCYCEYYFYLLVEFFTFIIIMLDLMHFLVSITCFFFYSYCILHSMLDNLANLALSFLISFRKTFSLLLYAITSYILLVVIMLTMLYIIPQFIQLLASNLSGDDSPLSPN